MSNNLDVTLVQLASEVNQLEADRAAGNRGKMVEMGHKLIEIRRILREVYGEQSGGVSGLDGRAPLGWNKWAEINLTFTSSWARRCIAEVVNPGSVSGTHRANQLRHKRQSAAYCMRQFSNVWPNLSAVDRTKVLDHVIALARETQHANAA